MKYLILPLVVILLSPMNIVLGQAESFTKIDSLFNSTYKANKPGAAFAIIKNGKVAYKNTIGMANIEYQTSITDTSVFHIASISKQFTTYLALLLEKEGKLSFNDPITKYLPELNHLKHSITIKQLTNHTHGLANYFELSALKGIFPKRKMTHKELVNMIFRLKQTNFVPGEKYQYNNTGYLLLAEIIERIEKKPFNEVLKQKILIPLKMNTTLAVDDISTIIPNKVQSYKLKGNHYQNFPIRLSGVGGSGLNTTINDLTLWAINYQQTTVGDPLFYKRMQQVTHLNSGKKINYGLGLQHEKYKGLSIVFHGGGDVGYRSYILHVPKHQVSFVILANTNDFSPLDIIYKSLDILLKDHIKENPIQKPAKLTNKQLEKYTGTYQFHPGIYYTITAKENNLYFSGYGSSHKTLLPHLGKNVFKFPSIPHSKLILYPDRFDFRIADFTYECKKTIIDPPVKVNKTEFIGFYINKELGITYELSTTNNMLTLKSDFENPPIDLAVLTKHSFYSLNLGVLDFMYTKDDLQGFKLSGPNFKGLFFEKL